MHSTASDAMASVIILVAAVVVLLITVSAYAVTTGFNSRTNDAAEQSGGFTTRSQDFWSGKRASGVLGGSSGSGGTAGCGCQNNAGRMSGPV